MMAWMRRRRIATGIVVAIALALHVAVARADQRDDFLAGRTRDCPRCDLAGQSFKRRDLSGANLNKANLTRADLRDAKVSDAMLYGAILDGASLAGADLTNALMGTARLT